MNKIKSKKEVVVILSDLRSALNVGAIFRTAEAAGVAKIYLTGYTPAPAKSASSISRAEKDLTKTALGAEKMVPWAKIARTGDLIRKLKQDGFLIIAVEQASNSIDYRKLKLKSKAKLAFIFGNEVAGLDQKVLTNCDQVIEIPMKGLKESLNVSVAAGVVLFRYL